MKSYKTDYTHIYYRLLFAIMIFFFIIAIMDMQSNYDSLEDSSKVDQIQIEHLNNALQICHADKVCDDKRVRICKPKEPFPPGTIYACYLLDGPEEGAVP